MSLKNNLISLWQLFTPEGAQVMSLYAACKQGRETWAEAWGKALTKLMDMATEQLAGRRIDIKKDTRQRTMER